MQRYVTKVFTRCAHDRGQRCLCAPTATTNIRPSAYDPDIPAVFVAGLRYSLFVRKIYYTVDLYMYAHVTQPQGAPLPGEITISYFFFARAARAENLRNGVTWGRKSARGCNVTPPENLFCPESVWQQRLLFSTVSNVHVGPRIPINRLSSQR